MKIVEGNVEYLNLDINAESILENDNLKVIKTAKSAAKRWKEEKQREFMARAHSQS